MENQLFPTQICCAVGMFKKFVIKGVHGQNIVFYLVKILEILWEMKSLSLCLFLAQLSARGSGA